MQLQIDIQNPINILATPQELIAREWLGLTALGSLDVSPDETMVTWSRFIASNYSLTGDGSNLAASGIIFTAGRLDGFTLFDKPLGMISAVVTHYNRDATALQAKIDQVMQLRMDKGLTFDWAVDRLVNIVFSNRELLINGSAGDDNIEGGRNNDVLNGNAGDDFFYATAGNDIIHGGAGVDSVTYMNLGKLGGVLADLGAGTADIAGFHQVLDGIEGLILTNRADNATGDDFDNFIAGLAGDDIISGAGGDDVIYGDTGNDLLFGNAGDDFIAGGRGADTIRGNGGNDDLYGERGHDSIHGDAGDDFISGGGGQDRIHGDAGDDFISGGDFSDRLFGDGGDDTIYGGDGFRDTISGGAGNDLIYGDNSIAGGGGHDSIRGGDGRDIIYGGEGKDNIGGDAGNDLLHGDDGEDVVSGDDGRDRIYGGSGADLLFGGKEEDKIFGGGQADEAFGGAGDDYVEGNRGDDELHGGAGKDVLLGGIGADIVKGGRGNDDLSGDAGADTFFFNALQLEGHDIIRDMASGDVIFLIQQEEVLTNVFPDGGGTLITYDGGAISLPSVDSSLLKMTQAASDVLIQF